MSSSQNKKNRGFDRLSNSKGRKSNKDDKTQNLARTAFITTIVVAVLFLAAIFLNSSFIRRNMTAVSIGSEKYSVSDFNFYYKNLYLQYYQSLGSSSGILPEMNALKSTVYDEETGQTWAEFFKELTLDKMKNDSKIYLEAQKAGFQLSEEDKRQVESEAQGVEGMAISYGYPDTNSYLKSFYGKGMDENVYRKLTERMHLIASYTQYINDAFIYTPEELEAFYTENKDTYDMFTYRYFLVTAEDVSSADYADEEALKTAQQQVVDAAGVKAGEIAAGITDEQSFIDSAKSYNPESYGGDDSTLRVYKGEALGSSYGDWLKDPARKEGDVSTFVQSTSGYYVVYYISRSDNHYATVNAQMILVKPAQVDQSEYADDQAAYDGAVEQARKTAEDTALGINDEWIAAGATQEKLAELTETNTDKISGDDSGLKEDIYRTQLPGDVDAWLYDPARKAGDHTMIYDESSGYYILYFAGAGKQYSDVLADSGKRSSDLEAWSNALPADEPKVTWMISLANL